MTYRTWDEIRPSIVSPGDEAHVAELAEQMLERAEAAAKTSVGTSQIENRRIARSRVEGRWAVSGER